MSRCSTFGAAVFTALGAQVTLIDTRDRLLPFVDAEIADRLRQQLEQLGRFSGAGIHVDGASAWRWCTPST